MTLGTKTVLFSFSLVFGDVGFSGFLRNQCSIGARLYVCPSQVTTGSISGSSVKVHMKALGATAAPTLRRPGLQSLQARLVCSADLQRSPPRPSRLSALDFDENGGRDCYECQDRC